jgi:hypothetical protein
VYRRSDLAAAGSGARLREAPIRPSNRRRSAKPEYVVSVRSPTCAEFGLASGGPIPPQCPIGDLNLAGDDLFAFTANEPIDKPPETP